MSGPILLLAQDGNSSRFVFNALKRDFDICGVVLEDPVPLSHFLKRRVQKLGVRTVLGQLAFRSAIVPILAKSGRARIRDIEREHGLDSAPIDPSKVTHVRSVNSEECRAALKRFSPAVVIVNGTRIIAGSTLAAAHAPFVNIHAGITPLYRGVHGGYWALAEGRPDLFGVTIHLVDTGIDTGGVLAQARIQPTTRDNFATYPYLQYAAALPILPHVIKSVLSGNVQPSTPPPGESRLWSHPTLFQYVRVLVGKGVR